MRDDVKRHRIYEAKQTKQIISVTRFFMDTIQGKCVLMETTGDVFAADIK